MVDSSGVSRSSNLTDYALDYRQVRKTAICLLPKWWERRPITKIRKGVISPGRRSANFTKNRLDVIIGSAYTLTNVSRVTDGVLALRIVRPLDVLVNESSTEEESERDLRIHGRDEQERRISWNLKI